MLFIRIAGKNHAVEALFFIFFHGSEDNSAVFGMQVLSF